MKKYENLSLEENMTACGEAFHMLVYHPWKKRWSASAFLGKEVFSQPSEGANTPQEALRALRVNLERRSLKK